jgi:Flp pilus assembly pilin Flp
VIAGQPTTAFLCRLVRDDAGQDQIEYALLTAAIALAGIAGFDAVRTALGSAYAHWQSGVNGLWESPPKGP